MRTVSEVSEAPVAAVPETEVEPEPGVVPVTNPPSGDLDSLQVFLAAAARYPLLTAVEEVRSQSGSSRATPRPATG